MLSNTPRKPQASVADVLFVIEGSILDLKAEAESNLVVVSFANLVWFRREIIISICRPPPPIELRHPRLKDFNTPFITRPIDNCLLISEDL